MKPSIQTRVSTSFSWFGDKLALFYNSVAPKLRDEMAADTPA